METGMTTEVTNGFFQFMTMLNWVYVIVFIIFAWLLNDLSEANNTAKWLNWFVKIPKIIRTLIVGILLIFVFAYFQRFHIREEYFSLVLSMFFSMVIYKIGIDKVLNWFGINILKIKKT